MKKIIWIKLNKLLFQYLSNKLYINLLFYVNCFRLKFKYYTINFNDPLSFNEKINFIKFNLKDLRYPIYADKFSVRSYVEEVIGSDYLIPLIDSVESDENLNFESYPEKFVIKINHGSGMNIIVKNKLDLNYTSVRTKLKKWLNSNTSSNSREWHYSLIKPKILIEKFMGSNLIDYKFFVYSGRVKFIQVDFDRFEKHLRNIYDAQWNLQPLEYCYKNNYDKFEKPIYLDEMISIAEKLAGDFIFCRVDLYLIDGKIYFGEITFHPEGGVGPFDNRQSDILLGKDIMLSRERPLMK